MQFEKVPRCSMLKAVWNSKQSRLRSAATLNLLRLKKVKSLNYLTTRCELQLPYFRRR
jgi:hypothetical protein